MCQMDLNVWSPSSRGSNESLGPNRPGRCPGIAGTKFHVFNGAKVRRLSAVARSRWGIKGSVRHPWGQISNLFLSHVWTWYQLTNKQDLQLYLLQLVQALKYEDFDEICAGLDPRSLMLSVRSFNSADSFPSPEKAGHDLSIDERFYSCRYLGIFTKKLLTLYADSTLKWRVQFLNRLLCFRPRRPRQFDSLILNRESIRSICPHFWSNEPVPTLP